MSLEDRRVPEGYDGPRACGPYELAPALDMINLVFRTQPDGSAPRAPSMGWDYSHIYNAANLSNVRIVCHQGRPVSSVGIYPTSVRTPHGTIGVGGINAVGTHPDHRRRGLNTLAMEDAHTTMRAAGLHIGLLATGISNYYRKLGWERAGLQRTFTFDRRSVTYLQEAAGVPALEVTDNWQSHVAELCALNNARDLGAVRDPARFELLALRKARQIFVGRRGGRVVAYAAVSGAVVREYGGEAPDVAGLLHQIFPSIETLPKHSTDRTGGQGGQYELTVLTPATGGRPPGLSGLPGLPELLLTLGVPASTGYLGMIKILDAPGLFGALGIEAEVEQRGAVWRLRTSGLDLELTDLNLVKLVFGPERRPELSPAGFPIEFFQWPMDRV
jgi:hypothetical protein